MASEKLNQAFIKAYGKRKPTSQPAAIPDPAEAAQESLIVRFDTATVPLNVPPLHAQQPPGQKALVTVSAAQGPTFLSAQSPIRSAAPIQVTQSPAAQFPATPTGTAEASFQQATSPKDSAPQAIQPPVAEEWSESGAIVGSDSTLSWLGSSTMILPQASFEPRAPQQSAPKHAAAPPSEQPVMLDTHPTGPARPNENGSAVNDPGNRTSLSSNGSERITHSADSFPASHSKPMIQKEDVSHLRVVEPTQGDSDALSRQIAAKNQAGAIYRLDRPNPLPISSETIADRPSSNDSQSDIQTDLQTSPQSVSDTRSDTHTFTGNDTDTCSDAVSDRLSESAVQSQPHQSLPEEAGSNAPPQRQEIRAKEEVLRQSRKRIFNPLWEVDRLDWPKVCLELRSAIEAKSPGVAKNLSSACQDGLQVMAVTSPVSGAGVSTVACCMAMLAGHHGMNVALVDGNTENPSLCYQTNLEIELDWHEAIAKRMPLEEVAVHSVDDQVTLIPLLARLSAPQLNEQNIANMLQDLSQSFDLVIVDLGHMAATKNMVSALGALGILNAVVTVIDRRHSVTENIESCLRQIRQSGIASIGLVENFAA
jgi:Mrp family chromosome partitioning ATPase